jgi:hydroxymethylbilane synthase
MNESVTIGSRGSKLALWQAEWVRDQLRSRYPAVDVELKIIRTTGDAQQTVSLSQIGGQGVFTKELESALLHHEIDLAVHSLKDLPTTLPAELTIRAITEREDPSDALVPKKGRSASGDSLLDLEENAVVGTSSPRRAAQLRALRPDVRIRELRGNIDTRLAKLDAGEYDYIILASAGLRRLGWAERIGFPIAPNEMLPAVGQGALGIEIRADDSLVAAMVAQLNHRETGIACLAERSFLRAAGGGCQLPLTAYARAEKNQVSIDGLMIDDGTGRILRQQVDGETDDAEVLGEQLARAMLAELTNASADGPETTVR